MLADAFVFVVVATSAPSDPTARPEHRDNAKKIRALISYLVQRKAHWPGAAASDVAITTKLERLLPVQCSEKYAEAFSLQELQGQSNETEHHQDRSPPHHWYEEESVRPSEHNLLPCLRIKQHLGLSVVEEPTNEPA
jgi:hypothetical protein